MMTEKHGPAWLTKPAVFEPFQNTGTFKNPGDTRDRHMNLTNKRKPTERHCTVLRTPFVCRPCIPAPPCVFQPVLSGVCVSQRPLWF
jgi:hypothetical protein